MSNFLWQWLARPARHGLAILGLVALCFAAALLSRASFPASVAASVTAGASAEAEVEVASAWPRAALRLWFILPRVSLP